jgi:hypothetical protein
VIYHYAVGIPDIQEGIMVHKFVVGPAENAYEADIKFAALLQRHWTNTVIREMMVVARKGADPTALYESIDIRPFLR